MIYILQMWSRSHGKFKIENKHIFPKVFAFNLCAILLPNTIIEQNPTFQIKIIFITFCMPAEHL